MSLNHTQLYAVTRGSFLHRSSQSVHAFIQLLSELSGTQLLPCVVPIRH